MATIGFIGFGEVATCLATALRESGAEIATYDILLESAGGSEKIKQRANDAHVAVMPLPDLLAAADVLLSTVTTDVALAAAMACVPHLKRGHVFVDLNATSPKVKRMISGLVASTGAAFIEGAILGAIGVMGAKTRILLCGNEAEGATEQLSSLGLNVGFYGTEIGRASTFKLLRSVFSKGMEALLLEALLAGRRAGIAEDLWREIVETLDERPFAEVGGNWVRSHGTAHTRRYHEMVQVEELVRELGIEPLVTRATAAVFECSTRLKLSDIFETQRPENVEAVLDALDDLLRRNTPSWSR